MWWQKEGLEQWLRDFLRDALRRRGVNSLLSDQQTDPLDLLSDPRSFGFSSLDMVQLASRFAACMGLDRTGLSDLLLARRSAKGWCDVARRSRQINDQEMGFYSSGSTSGPKLHRHQSGKLLAEAEYFVRALPVFRRTVCVVPSHHIYGFIWGILLPAENKVPCIFIDTDDTLPTSWARQLKDHDMIVAIPDTWQLLMELDIQLPDHFVGISSTAALPAATADFFRSRYPAAIMAEIYGSSETAGLAWRTVSNSGFTLLPWWQLNQLHQQTTAVSSITDEQHLLQDKIEIAADDSITVCGRTDRVIQIAGHNIDLDTLAEELTKHPDVEAAKVLHEPQDNNLRLDYFLALRKEPGNLQHWCLGFSRWLEQNLGDIPAPASVVVADELPRGILSKSVTWNIKQYDAVIGVYRSGFPALKTDVGIDKTSGLR
ncbi:MAG: AMP-binding protein [Pseudohongiella sp.]|nr:AMP-binding protein [Pseudohongiella sp.]